MLYDKRWDRTEAKPADVFSLESLIAWLEKQPAETQYNYMNCEGRCLLGLYLGGERPFLDFAGEGHPFEVATYRIACMQPRTFGAALDRARSALALSSPMLGPKP